MKYNTYLELHNQRLPPPSSNEDYPLVSCKYIPIQQLRTSEYVWSLIQQAPKPQQTFKHCLVDVKVHDLNKGQYPCKPGWHIDHRTNQVKPQKEIYQLLVTSDVSCTEFMTNEFESDCENHTEVAIPDVIETGFIQPLHWYSYDNHTFHRCTKAGYDGRRLLIRLCHTDTPGNAQHNFTPGVYV